MESCLKLIAEKSQKQQLFSYIKSKDNPADVLTRDQIFREKMLKTFFEFNEEWEELKQEFDTPIAMAAKFITTRCINAVTTIIELNPTIRSISGTSYLEQQRAERQLYWDFLQRNAVAKIMQIPVYASRQST